MYYVCSYLGTCIAISNFYSAFNNRFVINKLSLNIISHVGVRYNRKKKGWVYGIMELWIGVMAVG